jgi:hypothetical protein
MSNPAPPKDSNRLLMILGAVLVVLVLLAHASASWYEDMVARTTAPSLPQALGGTTGVVSAAWVDEGEVASEDTLRIWILVENRTAALANNLQFLAFHTPGYRKTGICWQRGVPSCRPDLGGGRPSPQGLAKSLRPGESTIVYAELSPRSWYGYHGASGVLIWQDEQEKNWERAVVLPAVQTASGRGRLLASIGKSLDLLKDLALPLALLILGGYLQRRDRERDHLQAEREKEQALLRETWTLMLPKVSFYAEQHYMPIESSISAFRFVLDMKDPPVEGPLYVLFSLLIFLRRMQHLAQETGGLFFRDLEGERLAGEIWSLFHKQAWKALDRKDYAQAMGVLSTKENYAAFVEKMEGRRPPSDATTSLLRISPQQEKLKQTALLLQRLSGKLKSWRDSAEFTEDRALLDLFDYILVYEMNRPYVMWYGKSDELNVEDFRTSLNKLGPTYENLKKRLDAYIKRFEEENKQREAGERA